MTRPFSRKMTILVIGLCALFFAATTFFAEAAPLPTCSIAITKYNAGESYNKSIMIAWTSSNAKSAYLHGVGSVGKNGAHAIYYPFKERYTLTVQGEGGSTTCDTQNVNSVGTIPGHASPPLYVLLTQIPYTGFDLGAFGNALYFAILVLFAVAGGYLVVYYQGGAFRFSLAQEIAGAARNQARFVARLFGF